MKVAISYTPEEEGAAEAVVTAFCRILRQEERSREEGRCEIKQQVHSETTQLPKRDQMRNKQMTECDQTRNGTNGTGRICYETNSNPKIRIKCTGPKDGYCHVYITSKELNDPLD